MDAVDRTLVIVSLLIAHYTAVKGMARIGANLWHQSRFVESFYAQIGEGVQT